MAIEKMKLVRTYGLIDHLDEFITSCCISGDFHPENAMDYISDSLGFVPLNEENPYSSSIQKIEEIASIAGVTLKDTFKGDEIIVDSNEFDYIDALKEKLSESFAKRTEISDKLQEVEASAEQFNHFIGIDIPIEELLSCEFLKVRFGSIPKDCYPKLKAYESNNLFVFLESSVDEKSHWGIYSAPRTQIDEVDRIFASLYFDRIRIPFSTGTPKEILAKLNAEKEKLTTELNKIDTEIVQFALDLLRVDKVGLDRTDRKLLKAMIELYDGGPVGLNTIAANIGEESDTIADMIEPYLMQIGFIKRTPRGRMVTLAAYEHLGIKYNKEG